LQPRPTFGNTAGLRAALAELKADMIKSVAGLLLAQAALVATLVKLLSYSLDNCRRAPTCARRRRLSQSTSSFETVGSPL
jgi:hypothetical protein